MAIHTKAKRQVEAGKKDYTLDAQRNGVDIYQLKEDPMKGFVIKTIGFFPSEKVTKFSFSGVGDMFTVVESEGMKNTLQFYMILKEQV